MDVIKQLNNIFYNKHVIAELRTYLQNKVTYVNSTYKRIFQQHPNTQFVLENHTLIYKQGNTKLPLLENEGKKREALDDVFDNDENAIGKGVMNLYKYICTKYVGGTRKDVSAFLATKGKYQMTQDMNKRINKLIISKFPNQI
jgi:hypothetical protein